MGLGVGGEEHTVVSGKGGHRNVRESENEWGSEVIGREGSGL